MPTAPTLPGGNLSCPRVVGDVAQNRQPGELLDGRIVVLALSDDHEAKTVSVALNEFRYSLTHLEDRRRVASGHDEHDVGSIEPRTSTLIAPAGLTGVTWAVATKQPASIDEEIPRSAFGGTRALQERIHRGTGDHSRSSLGPCQYLQTARERLQVRRERGTLLRPPGGGDIT